MKNEDRRPYRINGKEIVVNADNANYTNASMEGVGNAKDALDSHEQRLIALEGGEVVPSGVTQDFPQTLGELYCLRKAKEAIEMSAYVAASLRVPSATQSAGTILVGTPYSSTRKDNGFVPNWVTYETMFSALNDPNSYAYTKDPGFGVMGQLYYGIVCATFTCFCLGMPMRHRNYDMFTIDGVEVVETQNAQAMHIGYFINDGHTNTPHAMVCVGVTRDNGVVTHVTMAESVPPVCRQVTYTAADFNALLSQYCICKYNNLEKNPHYQPLSPFDKKFINGNLMPAKGNKSNWSTTENVVVDIIDKGSYTDYVVYKDGAQHSTASIGSATSINLGTLQYGKYSMVLKNSSNQSAPVEWIVVDMQMSAVARSGGHVDFTFSSANATPIGCAWGRNDYMLNIIFDLDEKDIATGTKDTYLSTTLLPCNGVSGYEGKGSLYDAYRSYYMNSSNKIYPRMLFETEFGVISTDWPSSGITYIG